jgi:hypothetical protein
MKKIFISLLFLISFTLNAQTVKQGFAGYATINSVSFVSGTTYNFRIQSFNGILRPFSQDAFTISDVAVGDIIWSSDCNRFKILTLQTASVAGTMQNLDAVNQVAPVNNTRVAVVREVVSGNTVKVSLPPSGDGNGGAASGISINMKACIESHYNQPPRLLAKRIVQLIIRGIYTLIIMANSQRKGATRCGLYRLWVYRHYTILGRKTG